jgi:uncharacterized membrane protein YtjA (UPF0391 family)
MLQDAVICFAITLIASLMGFGGFFEMAVEITKALAVVFLVLFFVTLYRVLWQSEPPRSADS